MRISYYTSGVPTCGIKDFSHQLLPEMEKLVLINHLAARWPNTLNYYRKMGRLANQGELLHIEYEPALYSVTGNPRRSGLIPFLSEVAIPVALTFHGGLYASVSSSETGGRAVLERVRRRLGTEIEKRRLRELFRRSEFISVFSEEHRDLLISLGVPAGKIVFSFHPIPKRSPKLAEVRSFQDEHKLHGKFVLVLAGFIQPHKGYETALRILPQLPGQSVLLIGGGTSVKGSTTYEQSLRELIRSQALEARVRWLGPLDEGRFLALLGAADLVLLPYLTGSGSGVLTTAISLRKDIICSNLPGFLALQSRYPCFEVFDRNRPEELAARIGRIIALSEQEAGPYIYRETGIEEALSFSSRARSLFSLFQSILEPAGIK